MLEEECRRLHRLAGSPRLVDEKPESPTSTLICVLGNPVIRCSGANVVALIAPYSKLPLNGRGLPTPVHATASAYLEALVARATTHLIANGTLTCAPGKSLPAMLPKRVIGKLRQTLWSIRIKQADACLYAAIWRHLDPVAARLTFRLKGGRTAHLESYAQVLQHQAVLLDIERTCPNLLPLVGLYAAPFTDVSPACVLDRNVIQNIKVELRKQGLTEAGWRMLARLGGGTLLVWRSIGEQGIALANQLGKLGPVPVSAVFLRWFRACRIQELLTGENHYPFSDFEIRRPRPAVVPQADRLTPDERSLLLRRMLEQAERARRRHQLQRFVTEELMLVEDALAAVTPALPRQLSWGWLMRYQARWHEDTRVLQESQASAQRWESLVAESTRGNITVVPLVDAWALHQEGRCMRHCVGSYADDCMADKSRIFSIRQSGYSRPRATFEIRSANSEEGRTWALRQVRGFADKPVDAALKRLAQEICRQYNAAQRKGPAALNFAHLKAA
jgi:hypothetical protein